MASIKLTGDSSGVITVSAPAAAGTNTLTLPATTGTVLDTNSALVSSKLTGALPAIDGSALTGISGGKILQVVSVTKDTSFTTTSTSFTDITGLSVAITPSATSSKILVLMNVATSNTTSTAITMTQLVRDSTAISIGASGETGEPCTGYTAQAGYDMGQVAVQYLDSPSTTSATTYKLQLRTTNGSQTAAVNRTGEYQSQQGNVASGITLMEVAG